MNTEEKKQQLQKIVSAANEDLTNILMEAAIAYQTKTEDNFIMPPEWIKDAEKRLADLRNEHDKGFTNEEVLQAMKDKVAEIKSYAS
ncbi:MAG: hypothetical protein KGL19_05485 [Bacteroidota bacterium]|nr:hypothetical protein [Bacteroidota bacterium]